MRKNRIPTDTIEKFLTTPSNNRNVIVNYIKDSLDASKNPDSKRSLALCFRGNYASVYYRCLQLLRIRNSRNGLIGEFDFRYSRFTEDCAEKKTLLENEYGVDFSGYEQESKSKRYARFSLEKDNAHILDILNIFKSLIEDFLYSKSQNIEKDAQQSLYAKYFYDDEQTYYDVEYAEHYAKNNGVAGRYDMLGIKKLDDGNYALVFTEIKSTPNACSGKSGISDHESDYTAYVDKTDLTAERKREACKVLELLNVILGKPRYRDLTPENITKVLIEFVFTDKAVSELGKYRLADGIRKIII